jgi:hypothetical protein
MPWLQESFWVDNCFHSFFFVECDVDQKRIAGSKNKIIERKHP